MGKSRPRWTDMDGMLHDERCMVCACADTCPKCHSGTVHKQGTRFGMAYCCDFCPTDWEYWRSDPMPAHSAGVIDYEE